VVVSEHTSEGTDRDDQGGSMSVSDDELPEDLQPREDNPLAEPAGDDVPDDVLKETAGGHAGESSEDDQGADADDEGRSGED
jgi:hypothetical protein